MTTATVKPAEGRRVRRPGDFQLLSPDGERVELDSYWRRLIKAGDVVVVANKPAAPKSASSQNKGGE
ncbi:DUF2635 domain-containing protein [Pseudomonas schmalbachii]|uniref:DUF2635 domain-containing protein n=1 Tax=Pseudomonas schmalbachii TaxID=2816993 RepID=A0ABS3TKG2_9PSED|nr:DUF2635 domain-containing protein [Pseudomonas schmalbachii]MBO3274131.1 DUF2635 domain-containing protein [Pseudomonas schmalbachii]